MNHPADKLVSLLTDYDRKQSKRKSYNRFALGQYLEAARSWQEQKPCTVESLSNFFTREIDCITGFSLPPVTAFAKWLIESKSLPVR